MSEEVVKPKVMVAVPTNRIKHYCLGKLVKSLKELEGADRIVFTDDTRKDDISNQNGQRGAFTIDDNYYIDLIKSIGFECFRVEETISQKLKPRIRDRLVSTRNLLRKLFLESDCTHMLFIDSDVIVPKYTIRNLLAPGKDIVTGVYWQLDIDGKARPVIYKYPDRESFDVRLDAYAFPLTNDDLVPSRIIGDESSDIQISAMGFGCVMISRKVLEDSRWQFRWDVANPDMPTTEDMWWSIDVKKLGYNIYCDTGIMCKHWPKMWEGAH